MTVGTASITCASPTFCPRDDAGLEGDGAGFAIIGVVIKAIDAAGAAAGANGLNVNLDSQLVSAIQAIAPAVKSAVPASAAK